MKSLRQATIIELIGSRDVETQGELTRLLNDAGFEVTQATVSRDIHELKLTKTPLTGKRHKYTMSRMLDDHGMERFNRVFRDGFVSMDVAGNLLVIHTFNGMAMAVGAAVDAMRHPEIVGSIAGDDVVMCATKTPEEAVALMEKLRK